MPFGETTSPELEGVARRSVDAAYAVYMEYGPGLLESAYEECLCFELLQSGIRHERQVAQPILYKGTRLDCGYRMDVVAERELVRASEDAHVIVRAVRRRVCEGVLREITAPQRERPAHRYGQVMRLVCGRIDADVIRPEHRSAGFQRPYAIARHSERVHNVRTDDICVADRQGMGLIVRAERAGGQHVAGVHRKWERHLDFGQHVSSKQ